MRPTDEIHAGTVTHPAGPCALPAAGAPRSIATMARARRSSHLDARGRARMVDVAGKAVTVREAVATGLLRLSSGARAAILGGRLAKGDALAVARLAGIQAAKRTPEWIPLCHHVALTSVGVEIAAAGRDGLRITATARAADRTGVEMEAMVAVAAAGLALYDMAKSVDRGMRLEGLRLLAKSGGRSGDWHAARGRRPRG